MITIYLCEKPGGVVHHLKFLDRLNCSTKSGWRASRRKSFSESRMLYHVTSNTLQSVSLSFGEIK